MKAGTMTTKQADQAIRSGRPVLLYSERYDETFLMLIVSRDRYNVRGYIVQTVFSKPEPGARLSVISRDELIVLEQS